MIRTLCSVFAIALGGASMTAAQAGLLEDEYVLQSDSGVPQVPVRVPEGIAFDILRAEFYASSIFGGKITRLPALGNGTEEVFHQEQEKPWLVFTGLKVDPLRRVVWACATDQVTNPNGPEGFVYAFRIHSGSSTGTLIKKFPLPFPALCNDVALDFVGNAYVTNSFGDTLYRIKPSALTGSGGAQAFATSPLLAPAPVPGALGMNGLDVTPNQKHVIVVTSQPARIVRVSIDNPADVQSLTTTGDAYAQNPDPGGDPLRYLVPDGIFFAWNQLYVVYNGAVQQLTFTDSSYLNAHIKSTSAVPIGLSSGASVFGELYVVDSEVIPVTQPQFGYPIELPHKIVRVKRHLFQ